MVTRRLLRKLLFGCASFLFVWPNFAVANLLPNAPIDPLSLYGTTHKFLVLRDNAVVGDHVLNFFKLNNQIIAETKFNIKISFLGLSLYNYQYESRGVWEEDRLQRIDVRVNDDGKEISNTAQMETAGYSINNSNNLLPNTTLFPTSHWNTNVLKQGQVFNTILGKLNTVEITNLGPEKIKILNGFIEADHYRYTGELRLDAWYDKQGRWVKLKFLAEDQSTIEYLCTTCSEFSK